MTDTTTSDQSDDLHRIADALERLADRFAPLSKTTNVTVNLTGTYAGTKDDLAATVTKTIRQAQAKGQIPPWRAA